MASQILLEDGRYPVATPESVGIRSEDIARFIEHVNRNDLALQSLQIVRKGKLVFSAAAEPQRTDGLHRAFSMGKAFPMMAVLFAIQEGLISLDTKVAEYFTDKLPEEPSDRILNGTVYDYLTMNSGHTEDPFGPMMKSEDWIRAFYAHPFNKDPGTHFLYDNGVPHLLAALVEKVSGMHMDEYLRSRFLDPVGVVMNISRNRFDECDPSTVITTPQSILNFSVFLLQEGMWNGQQLLRADLVRAAGCFQSPSLGHRPWRDLQGGYGFQLWRNAMAGFRMAGGLGQYGVVIPEQDMAVSIMACSTAAYTILEQFFDHVYKNMRSHAIPEAPYEQDQLKFLAEHWTQAPWGTVSRSQLCGSLEGKTYRIRPNELEIEDITFSFREADHALVSVTRGGKRTQARIGLGGAFINNEEEFFIRPDTSRLCVVYGEEPGGCIAGGGFVDEYTFVFRIMELASVEQIDVICEFKPHLKMTLIRRVRDKRFSFEMKEA